jgi:hypothetical protein
MFSLKLFILGLVIFTFLFLLLAHLKYSLALHYVHKDDKKLFIKVYIRGLFRPVRFRFEQNFNKAMPPIQVFDDIAVLSGFLLIAIKDYKAKDIISVKEVINNG